MISVLIPVYNEMVVPLVNQVNDQLQMAKIPYQILVIDDKSEEHYKLENAKLSEVFNVSYMELSENIGRAKIRNRLAKLARYEHLIFLDCDVAIKSPQFIQNYMECLIEDCVCGGITYQDNAPSDAYFLHWKAGKKKEELSPAKRQKSNSFFSSNFMIKAKVFDTLLFDDSISGYGYEDLEFSQRLTNQSFKIHQINNPVQHNGLNTNKDYLKNVEKGMINLAKLYLQGKVKGTPLISTYERIKASPISEPLLSFLSTRREKLEYKLSAKNPSLWTFDLWKLVVFIDALKSN